MRTRTLIGSLFAFGCVAHDASHPTTVSGSEPPTSTTPVSSARPIAGASSPAQPQDDPSTCVDRPNPETRWREDLKQRAEEKLPELEQCRKVGKLDREERFSVALASSKDGTPKKSSVLTTMPGCTVADCVAKKLDAVQREPWPGEGEPQMSFELSLSPDQAPRTVFGEGESFDYKTATRCGPAQAGLDVTKVSGRIAPEIIQRIVRSNYGKFRACYEEGLGRNRNLKGKVVFRFVIERDGTVSHALIEHNTLPDCKAAKCIRDEFPKMTFPAPDGGIVTVVYPIMFEPG